MAGLKSIVEFGTSKIVCMISNTKPGGSDIPGFSCIRYDGIKEGRWLNYDAVKDCADEAIAAAETKMRTQIRSCHVAVPGLSLIHICVLFRSVYVGKGTVIRDSVIMQDSEIYQNCQLENAILDKQVQIRSGRRLVGDENYPVIISKGAIV